MSTKQDNILIIGGPNAGKTHFGGQLYGRLTSRSGAFIVKTPPSNLTLFQDVLEKLSEGKSGQHTQVSQNSHIELQIEDKNRREITLAFPDYGGEQIKNIVALRRLDNVWREYVERSDNWVLFIRLEEIQHIEDIVNRGMPDPEIIKKREQEPPPASISTEGYFIELLQILLHFKGISTFSKLKTPKLVVVISCWDLLDTSKEMLPIEQLQQKLPMLHNFINSTWEFNSRNIIGLSSTERTLTDKQIDKDYVENGPENFGYYINPDGRKNKDLTLLINTFLGR